MTTEYRRLIGAMFIQLLRDWQDEEHQPEIRRFLQSDYFAALAEAVGFQPDVLRIKLEQREFDVHQLRAAYR